MSLGILIGNGPNAGGICPFYVVTRANPNAPNQYQAKILNNGTILNTDGSPVTINNLNTWFNLDSNDTIWFEADVENYTITSIDILSYGQGNNTLTDPNSYWVEGGLTEDDGGTPASQTVFRKVIAVFTANAQGTPQMFGYDSQYNPNGTQQSTTNLQIFNIFLQDEPAIYPYPA